MQGAAVPYWLSADDWSTIPHPTEHWHPFPGSIAGIAGRKGIWIMVVIAQTRVHSCFLLVNGAPKCSNFVLQGARTSLYLQPLGLVWDAISPPFFLP